MMIARTFTLWDMSVTFLEDMFLYEFGKVRTHSTLPKLASLAASAVLLASDLLSFGNLSDRPPKMRGGGLKLHKLALI